MKKFAFVLLSLLFASLPSLAMGPKYNELLRVFEKGAPVSFEEIQGIHEGRCYTYSSEKADPSVLGAFITDDETEDGPLFNPQKRVILVSDIYYANIYKTSSEEELQKKLMIFKDDFWILPLKKLAVETQLELNGEWQFARSGKYIVTKKITYHYQLSKVCYFFNKK